MALSSLYLAFVRIVELLRLVRHDNEELAVEVVMLRHEVDVWEGSSRSPTLCCADTVIWSVVAGHSPTDQGGLASPLAP